MLQPVALLVPDNLALEKLRDGPYHKALEVIRHPPRLKIRQINARYL